ncbi:MAG TPA: TolC family protein [Candidatus Krumholzibacteria bacterium]|nr:TolC family protein [Candidatus Krumholzibacteria bacterium]HPD70368.1 TolC family protein [Candidatus Krumholzibacteria bacterium]HRY39932.1 TolC family protein [Candidatus Krumholzibacteria bacterium]
MLIPIAVLALASGLPATTLDLATCLDLARAHAPRLREATAVEEQAAAASREARARRAPTVSLGASYRYTSEVMEQHFELGPYSRSLEFGDGHAADLNVGVNAPLFTGGELRRQSEAAAAGVEAAAQRAAATGLDVARDVRAAFYIALGRESQAAASRLAVERLQRHVGEVAGTVDAGAATEESRLRALARLREAEQLGVRLVAARDSAAVALGRLVGSPDVAVTPAGELTESLLTGGDLSPARVAERPDLVALAREEERQTLLAEAQRGRLWPRVGADVRAHYGRPGVDLIANEWTPYATAAVSLDWPLWDDGARTAAASQLAALARQAAARRAEAADALAAAHAAARIELDAAVAAETLAGERVELARRILDLVGGRLRAAAATESEFLDTQDDLTAAELDLALARTRVRLAEAVLLWTVGQ